MSLKETPLSTAHRPVPPRSRSGTAGWVRRLFSLAPAAARPGEAVDVVFPPGFLASLERLRVAALKALGGGLREGHRLGAYKGGQLEFHGHRSYTAGDELRYVDWNSYARLGRPYVKEFAREEAGVLHILLDGTPSMLLGRPSKWTFARRVAALFAHVALSSNDAVYLHVFDAAGKLIQFPDRGAKSGSAGYISFLEKRTINPVTAGAKEQRQYAAPCHAAAAESKEQAKQPACSLAPSSSADELLSMAATRLLRSGALRGGLIILSDFWQTEQAAAAAISRLSGAGFEVSAIHLLAPEEIAPDARGDLLARSLEEEDGVGLYFTDDLAARYSTELERHRCSIEEIIRRRGGNYLLAGSDTALEKVLISILRQRRWVV